VTPEDSFERLAQRDAELSRLATRGRRRSLRILIVALVPVPVIVMLLNNDTSAAGVIPVVLVLAVTVYYSWQKWQRHPEETQSIAFMGLDRRTRWSAYRSMWRGTGVDSPVVLTIFESIYAHLRRSFAMVIATMCVTAGLGVTLVQVGGSANAMWVSTGIVALLALAIAQQGWIVKRAGVVIDRSRSEWLTK
jgi:hypothetical protein